MVVHAMEARWTFLVANQVLVKKDTSDVIILQFLKQLHSQWNAKITKVVCKTVTIWYNKFDSSPIPKIETFKTEDVIMQYQNAHSKHLNITMTKTMCKTVTIW